MEGSAINFSAEMVLRREVVVVCVRVLVIVRKVVAAALVLMDENPCAVSGNSNNAHTALFLKYTIFLNMLKAMWQNRPCCYDTVGMISTIFNQRLLVDSILRMLSRCLFHTSDRGNTKHHIIFLCCRVVLSCRVVYKIRENEKARIFNVKAFPHSHQK